MAAAKRPVRRVDIKVIGANSFVFACWKQTDVLRDYLAETGQLQ
jgi:hypothetical protein